MRILSRDEWEARPPRSVSTIPTPSRRLILHHAAVSGTGPGKVRAHQRYHMDVRGYVDIAYNWLADDVQAYEGRGAGVAGAHTRGFNDDHAVCALGDFTDEEPSDALLDVLAALAVHAWREGAVDEPAFDGGHRDYGSTSCPGDRLYMRIPEINRRAAALAEGRTVTSGRIAGEDGYATAAAMARTIFPHQRHQGGIVWIVRGDKWTKDAIAAGQIPGPCLPVPPDGDLPQVIADEIAAYRPDRVMAIGGTGAVSESILEQARKAAG